MKKEDVRNVMVKYGNAWEKKSADLILNCFTKNGIYQESPLSKPYKGHAEIRKFWNKSVGKHTKQIKFKLVKYYVSNDSKTGFAEWECKNVHKGKKHHMAGVMILKMKGDKITSLNEYWNTKIK